MEVGNKSNGKEGFGKGSIYDDPESPLEKVVRGQLEGRHKRVVRSSNLPSHGRNAELWVKCLYS